MSIARIHQQILIIPLTVSSIAGNVHTGAIPPWLIEDNDTNDHSKPATIGPSEDDFFKWSEKILVVLIFINVASMISVDPMCLGYKTKMAITEQNCYFRPLLLLVNVHFSFRYN